MDAVTLAAARAGTARALRPLRVRDVPGMAGVPSVMGTPPTLTLNTSTGMTSPTLVRMDEPGAFTYLGGIPAKPTSFGGADCYANLSTYTAGTSSSPWASEFWLDSVTGTFEPVVRSSVNYIRVAVEVGGKFQYVSAGPSFTLPAGGSTRYCTVALGAAYTGRVRIEMDANVGFYGVNVGSSDTIRATKAPKKRLLVIGDSFSEPTVTDTATHFSGQGFPLTLGPMLGVDTWACGLGGTGYLNTLGGTKPTCRSRSADWTTFLRPGDIALFCNGINDYANFTAAAIAAELALCLALVPAGVEIVVTSPMWRNGNQTFPTNLLLTRDQLKATALAAGAKFLDVLTLPLSTTPLVGTLQANTAQFANTVTCDVLVPNGGYFRIGSGTTSEVRKINGTSGSSAPFSMMFGAQGGLANAHTAGEPITQVGGCIYTGTGKQGSTVGDGNSDRYTGNDSTHPTAPGHLNIAGSLSMLYAATLQH